MFMYDNHTRLLFKNLAISNICSYFPFLPRTFFLNCQYQSKSYFLKNDNVSDYSYIGANSCTLLHIIFEKHNLTNNDQKKMSQRSSNANLFLIIKTSHPHIPGENRLTK